MKTEEKTIKNAFAWDKQVLCKKLMKENNNSFILGGTNVAAVLENPYTPYYSDAVKIALTRYIADKVCILDSDINVVMTVKTKDGIEHPYSTRIGNLFNPDADMVYLQRELVQPTSVRMTSAASNEIQFDDVESVSCYVEDVP